MKSLAIIIPCFNESSLLLRHLAVLGRHLDSDQYLSEFEVTIILVDDGSRAVPEPPPMATRCILLRHLINLGQGAALQTGIAYARKELRADLYVTMDADGQHRPEELERLLDPVVKGRAEIVFGNRFLRENRSIPGLRRWILRAGIRFEKLITGLDLGDSHNGYRAFNRGVADRMEIQLNRMAHATEIKQIVAREGFRYEEVPVEIAYTAETLAKGQRNLGALVILKDLLTSYLFRKTAGHP